MKRLILILLILTSAFSSVSCSAGDGTDDGRLSVVTTNFALYDFARAVCGEQCDVTMLLSPGSESHDFEATLSDIAKITDSDLFVYIGGESEDWIGDIFDSLDSMGEEINSMCALDSVETFAEEITEGMTHVHDDSCEIDHDHEDEADEHVWTSIPNAVAIMTDIKVRLAELDPTIADKLEENTREYSEQLFAIDEEIKSVVESAENKTIIVADRFPFRYFAEHYGLDYYAAFSGCSSDVEPTLDTVNFLIERTKELSVPIFVIEFSDGTTAKAVQAETGCDILCLHSAHNVTREDFEGGITYADIMRRNCDALKIALN
ncbi:MAG: zinc ABC transporter substrate-binding protein [Ruminococcaceae bacterium]|nr:zinc ABC transporter substrate-binding protein [Oscillospiraceae bacterium]